MKTIILLAIITLTFGCNTYRPPQSFYPGAATVIYPIAPLYTSPQLQPIYPLVSPKYSYGGRYYRY